MEGQPRYDGILREAVFVASGTMGTALAVPSCRSEVARASRGDRYL